MSAAGRPSGTSSRIMQPTEWNPEAVKGASLPNFDESASTVKEMSGLRRGHHGHHGESDRPETT